MQEIKKITDADVSSKRVLLRTSLNVPISETGEVGDLFRLKAAVPTIEYLAERGARTVIVAHLGRAGDSLARVVEALQGLTKVPLRFFAGTLEEAREESEKLSGGECLVLENIRREKGEEENSAELAQALAKLGVIFINDAFADSHRSHASIVGVAALLPSYAGLLMAKEIEKLSQALTPPEGSIAIIGGAKFETKQPLIEKLLATYAKVLLGGALGNDVLKARGFPFGTSLVSSVPVPTSVASNENLVVPTDAMVSGGEEGKRFALITDVRADEKIADIGPLTATLWRDEVAQAPFVLWNGPLGIYEKGFIEGTTALAHAFTKLRGFAVIGGGDTAAAIAKLSFDPERIFVSTGGGAMLEFLTHGTLAGLEPLKK